MELETLAARVAEVLGEAMDRPAVSSRPDLLTLPGDPLSDYLARTLPPGGELVLPRLTGETVCQVWAGVCLTGTARRVFAALCRGERVWVPKEGVELGNGALSRTVKERLEVLRRNGLTICPLGELGEARKRGERDAAGTGDGGGMGHPEER